MLLTCFSTALSVTTSDRAIAGLLRPSAISASTSRSRGVSRSSGSRRRRPGQQLGDDLGIERRAAGADPPHGGEELGDVGDAVLEEVPDRLGRSPASRSVA